MTRISPLSLAELNDVTKNEVFFIVAFRMETYVQMMAVNFFLLFVRLLKYFAFFFERVMIIFKTL